MGLVNVSSLTMMKEKKEKEEAGRRRRARRTNLAEASQEGDRQKKLRGSRL